MAATRSKNRKQDILVALATMLEENTGKGITTAALARKIGVSEAALYRHFPSKAKMFEGLLDFVDQSVFTLINRILEEDSNCAARVQKIMALIMGFAEKNPGIARLLYGDVLLTESERLQNRVEKFYDQVGAQLRQILRQGAMEQSFDFPVEDITSLLMFTMEGSIAHYVRSGFREKPLVGWDNHWAMLEKSIFH